MITITVNEKEYQCTDSTNLNDFLKEIGFPNLDNLAIAVNETIVPKKTVAEYKLNANDKIVLIKATCGG